MVQRRAYLSKKTAPEIIRFQGLWSEMGDSNSRHLAPKAGALPTALHPVIEFFIRLGVFSQTRRDTSFAIPGYARECG